MKLFKRIYYPVMAVIFAVMLIFGFVDAYRGSAKNVFDKEFMSNVNDHLEFMASDSRNAYNVGRLEDVRDYLVGYLSGSDGGLTVAVEESDPDDDGNDLAEVALLNGVPTPTTVVQNAVLTQDTLEQITVFGEGEIIVEKEVNNIVTYIPGKKSKASYAENQKLTGDVVMFMAHYDSVKYGAMDNASSVATMLENIRFLLDSDESKEFENDLLFVFTDAEEEGMYGAYAFANQFKGFDDVYSRVGLGLNFDSLGNGGTLVMFQSNAGNQKLIASYSKINGGTFISSVADFVYNSMSNFTDFEIYGDIPSLNFANVGGTKIYHSAIDDVKHANKQTLKEQAYMMYKLYNAYGDYDLSSLVSDGSEVFFSYLDMGVVAYPSYVSYIIAGVTLALLIAVIAVNVKKKAFGWGKTLAGALTQILALVATVVSLFGVYFAVTLLLSLFGVVQVRAITSLRYMNVGILLGAMLIAGALVVAFYIVLKKAMSVKASDLVRGNALVWTLIALILGFAMPALSYLFAFTALLQLVVMLMYTIFKDKYKARFNQDMERLFLYAWPMIVSLPLILPVMTLASSILSSLLTPVIMVLFLLMAGAILPYANYLRPTLDKAVKKYLPQRSVRVERTVIKRVEDEAKKGKFTEKEVKEITKEKVERTYKNRFGIAIASCLAVLIMIFSASFVGSFNAYVTGSQNVRNVIYDGSVVYLWDSNGTSANTSLMIKDKTAYKYFAPHVKGFKWDSDEEAFMKAYNNRLDFSEPTITKSEGTYTVTPSNGTQSKITLTLTGTADVTEFTFSRGGESVTYTNNGLDTRVFKLPYGYGQFTMTVTSSSDTTPTLGISYVEEIVSSGIVEQIDEIEKLRVSFAANDKIAPYITTGMVLRLTKSL